MRKLIAAVLVSFSLAAPLRATETIQTWQLVGYPVIVDTETDTPKNGVIMVAWPGEDVRPSSGAPTAASKTPRIIVLVELENGRFCWRDILQVKVDVKKRAEQLKQMQPPPPQAIPQGKQVPQEVIDRLERLPFTLPTGHR